MDEQDRKIDDVQPTGDIESSEQDEPYRWTLGRLAVGMAFLLIGLAIPGYVYWDLHLKPYSNGRSAGQVAMQAIGMDGMSIDFYLDNLQVDKASIMSGGPPRDGIPSLRTELTKKPEGAADSANPAERPTRVIPISEAEDYDPTMRIVGVEIGGEARAYPISILNYHEAVNDELGGVPICVVYCPLCDSVTVVDRRIDGKTLEFGISGLLKNSNVLLYDRNDMALWSQVLMIAISGPHAGQSLKHLDGWCIKPLSKWRQMQPDSTILSMDTGYPRDYRGSPYEFYFTNDDLMFPVMPEDDRIAVKKTPVIGIRRGDQVVAVPVKAIQSAEGNTLKVPLGDDHVVLAGSDDGELEFVIRSMPSGTNIVHTYWFAWAAYHPDTKIFPKP